MLKALATGHLSGVLQGAKSPANLLIANEHARALAPGKCAPGTGPGLTPDKLCLRFCRLSDAFWSIQAFADITPVIFKPCKENCQGLTLGKMHMIFFFLKKTFFNCLKNLNIKI